MITLPYVNVSPIVRWYPLKPLGGNYHCNSDMFCSQIFFIQPSKATKQSSRTTIHEPREYQSFRGTKHWATASNSTRQVINYRNYYFSFLQNTTQKLEKCASFGEVFFILFSITDRVSFLEAKRLGKYIQGVKDNDCVMILVGTKTDLCRYRRVSRNEGYEFAREIRSVFCEISVSEGFVETNSLLNDSLRLHLSNKTDQENGDKEKAGPLSRMKEGFKGIYTRRKSCSL